MACEAKVRLASIDITAHLEFVLGRISADGTLKIPKVFTLLTISKKLR